MDMTSRKDSAYRRYASRIIRVLLCRNREGRIMQRRKHRGEEEPERQRFREAREHDEMRQR